MKVVVLCDRVDHERIAFVMADRFPVIGGLRVRRMRHVEIDAAHLRVARIHHPHLFGRLQEEQRLEAADQHEGGRARGDIFISEGHAPTFGNSRIMKFDKNGKFIKSFGHLGSGDGELKGPHV
jgi:hypothetical protein